jgi:hypothetical protein
MPRPLTAPINIVLVDTGHAHVGVISWLKDWVDRRFMNRCKRLPAID